jgi:hypothetical protein
VDYLERRVVQRQVRPGKEEKENVSTSISVSIHNKIHEQEEKFSRLKGAIEKVHVLEAMPTLEAKRKGEIKY